MLTLPSTLAAALLALQVQTTPVDSLHAPRMADTVTVLPPVKVDADRTPLDHAASATTVRLDRAQLVRFQPLTTADALLSAPGVDLTRTGPWASRVSVRGLSGERVLVLVDGVRLQSGRGHGAQTSLVSVDRLESVEVSPGSGGAQSGSDALGGVVELNTHHDLFTSDPSAHLMITSHGADPGGEWSSLARLRVGSPRLGAELAGGLGGLTALVTPDGSVAHSGHREQELTGRGAAKLGVATLDFEHQQHAAYDIGLPAFNSDAGSTAEYPIQERDVDRFEVSSPLAGRLPALRLLAVQQRFRTDYVETTADSQYFRSQYIALRTTNATDRLTTWARGLQPSAHYGDVKFDGEWRRETTTGPRLTDVVVANPSGQVASDVATTGQSVPNAHRDILAGGAMFTFRTHGVRFDDGARYEWQHSQADSTADSFTSALDVENQRWTWESGLSRPFGAWTPYARVATGFRSPNLEERYFNDDIHGGMRLFGNPALLPERSLTYEGGIRVSDALGGHLSDARLSAYRSTVEDLVSLTYLGQLYLVPRFQYTNIDRARLEGIEGHAAIRLGSEQLVLDAAAPRGIDLATGKPVPDIGAARATMDVRFPLERFFTGGSLSLRARWTDASGKGDPNLARPAFWTGAVELGATVMDTRVTAAIRNVTATRYREPLSFIDEPGRSFALSVRREFSLSPLHAH